MIDQMLTQLNEQASRLAKQNAELINERELLRCNLRIVAEDLRNGISKINQKTKARVIENQLAELKKAREL